MLVFLFFLFNVVDGISLAKMHNSSNFAKIPVAKMDNSDLMSQILASKGDRKALLGVLADADPAKVNQILTLLRALLADSQSELAALIASSNTADSDYNDAVAAHNAAVVAQSDGVVQLQAALDAANTAAQATYDQGSTALQAAVDAAQVVVDTTRTAKNTANGVLAADRSRLDNEIATLIQVIALMEGLLGLNTFAPTSSPAIQTTGRVTRVAVQVGGCIENVEFTYADSAFKYCRFSTSCPDIYDSRLGAGSAPYYNLDQDEYIISMTSYSYNTDPNWHCTRTYIGDSFTIVTNKHTRHWGHGAHTENEVRYRIESNDGICGIAYGEPFMVQNAACANKNV